jgi:hypothetical protein
MVRTLELNRGVGAAPPARDSILAPRPNATGYDYIYRYPRYSPIQDMNPGIQLTVRIGIKKTQFR